MYSQRFAKGAGKFNIMNISIIGASGFVGKNLISYLLKNTEHHICAISRNPQNIEIEDKYKNRLKIIKADASNYEQMHEFLSGTDIAYYLVHRLSCCCDKLYREESEIAKATGRALKDNEVKRVIYLSGLGDDRDQLSLHLKSRHNTGRILREYVPNTIEFRASIIVGEGSISFEIIKDIVNKAPIILLPKKAKTETEPITIDDVLLYLSSVINVELDGNEIVEIGGPEIMTYEELLRKYRNFKNKKTPILIIPFLKEETAGSLLSFFTSKDRAIVGQNMIKSFENKMIVTNNKAEELFPNIKPMRIENRF